MTTLRTIAVHAAVATLFIGMLGVLLLAMACGVTRTRARRIAR